MVGVPVLDRRRKIYQDFLLWFLARTDNLKRHEPENWFSNLHYILLEVILVVVRLSNIYNKGEISFG